MQSNLRPFALCLSLAALPVWAEVPDPQTPPPSEVDEGFSLMEEGAKLLFKGLMTQMEPALDDMGKALEGLEPALKDLQPKIMDLLALIDDLQHYEAPVRMPNGDILLRRKPDAPALPPVPESGAATEL